MLINKGARVAVIGAGISGIAAANTLKKNGFTPVVFEKHEKIGGVWATAYPEVHLQNIYTQYHLSDFDWQFKPDLHPTGEQIMRYLTAAVEHLKLDVRLKHEILEMKEQADGWLVRYKNKDGIHEEAFEYVILAAGQYTDGKNVPQFPDQEQFKGRIITERDITSLNIFNGKRVVVVGYGKSALDMATLAAERSAKVQHIFRTPSWRALSTPKSSTPSWTAPSSSCSTPSTAGRAPSTSSPATASWRSSARRSPTRTMLGARCTPRWRFSAPSPTMQSR
jgi:cation diffusion facilitator CzcD-associated flavoprotein CzcO